MLLAGERATAVEDAAANVGIEAVYRIDLPPPKLAPKPVERKTPLILRIASAMEKDGRISYEFRYLGLAPGRHDLAAFLQNEDGSPAAGLPPMPVEIRGFLPADHDGTLVELSQDPLRVFGSYRMLLWGAGIVWALLLVPILLWKRQRKVRLPEPEPAPEPTLADVLRPLVEQAAAGTLDAGGKARLERLLIGFWREKLGLGDDLAPDEVMSRLRSDERAGKLVLALENWLHRRPGTAAADVEELLADFRQVSADAQSIRL